MVLVKLFVHLHEVEKLLLEVVKHADLECMEVVLPTGPGNLPAVRVRTGKMVQFSSRTFQEPDLPLCGSPTWPRTRQPGAIAGFGLTHRVQSPDLSFGFLY